MYTKILYPFVLDCLSYTKIKQVILYYVTIFILKFIIFNNKIINLITH